MRDTEDLHGATAIRSACRAREATSGQRYDAPCSDRSHATARRMASPHEVIPRHPSTAAARLLPALRVQGLVTSVTPDLPLRTEAAQSIGYCTDPLCDT